jgi:hypothetical protein
MPHRIEAVTPEEYFSRDLSFKERAKFHRTNGNSAA